MTTLNHEAGAVVPHGMHMLSILDATGDTRLAFAPMNVAEVAEAEKMFNEAMGTGHTAFKVDDDGTSEMTKTFDPTATRTIVTTPLVGG